MTFPSPDDAGALKSLMESDAVFRDKLDTATSLAETLGKEAIAEIYAAQLSLQRLSEGGYPPEMAEVIKNKARKTIKRYWKFLSVMSSLKESRLSRSYGPGESPIHSLPSEILSIIFPLAAQYSPTFDRKRWMPSTLRLVCHRWKETAEDTPTLWRNVDITNGLQRTQRTLQWSKSVSLNVRIADPVQPSARFMECAQVALAELPRIRTLTISTSFTYRTKEPRELTKLLASRPAPLLMEFDFLPQQMNYTTQIMSQSTFTGETPAQLRIVNVNLTKIHPLCPIFRAPLTSLTLQFCTIWDTVNELLLALAGLPMLEHLMLRANHPVSQLDVSAVHDIGHKAVKLLNLKTLYIRDGIEVLLAIFPRLDISSATEATVCAAAGRDEDIDFSAQIHVLLPEMNNAFGSYVINAFGDNVAPPDAFTSLTITFADIHSTGYSAAFSNPAVHRNGLAQFSLGFDQSDTYVDELRALFMRTLSWTPMNYRISRLVAIEEVELLHNDATWLQIFECLQSLEEVHVGLNARYFIRSITACNPDAVRSLRKLVFKRATLDDTMIDALAALLSARQGLGHPSLILSFITCSITSEALDKLEGTPGAREVYVHVDPRMMPRVDEVGISSDSD